MKPYLKTFLIFSLLFSGVHFPHSEIQLNSLSPTRNIYPFEYEGIIGEGYTVEWSLSEFFPEIINLPHLQEYLRQDLFEWIKLYYNPRLVKRFQEEEWEIKFFDSPMIAWGENLIRFHSNKQKTIWISIQIFDSIGLLEGSKIIDEDGEPVKLDKTGRTEITEEDVNMMLTTLIFHDIEDSDLFQDALAYIIRKFTNRFERALDLHNEREYNIKKSKLERIIAFRESNPDTLAVKSIESYLLRFRDFNDWFMFVAEEREGGTFDEEFPQMDTLFQYFRFEYHIELSPEFTPDQIWDFIKIHQNDSIIHFQTKNLEALEYLLSEIIRRLKSRPQWPHEGPFSPKEYPNTLKMIKGIVENALRRKPIHTGNIEEQIRKYLLRVESILALHLRGVKEMKSFTQNISFIDLFSAYLRGVDFRGLEFPLNFELNDSDLREARLEGVDLSSVDFSGVHAKGATITYSQKHQLINRRDWEYIKEIIEEMTVIDENLQNSARLQFSL